MNYQEIANKYRDEYYQTLKDIISINSIKDENSISKDAPFGKGCKEALDYMLAKGEEDGFKVKNYDGYAGVIEYGESDESIGVLAHLDVVTVGDDWTRDPFNAELVEGFVFGRGVADDKGPALSGYFAMKAMKDLGIKPKRKIMLILGCDEESGMECMKYYKEHGEIPTLGFTPDADFPLIYGESGMAGFEIVGKISDCPIIEMDSGERPNIVLAKANAILNGADDIQKREFEYYLKAHNIKGCFDGENIEMIGKAAHSAYVYHGVNAGLHLLNFLGISYDNHECRELYNLLHDYRGSKFKIDNEGSNMAFLTMNIGLISVKDSVIRITVDIRYPDDLTGEEIIEKVQATLDEKLDGFKLENIDLSHRPLFINPNSAFVKTLLNAYRELTGDVNTPPMAIRGGTYAKCFDNFVAFGPELPVKRESSIYVGDIHQGDEGIFLDDLINAIAIYLKSIIDLQEVSI